MPYAVRMMAAGVSFDLGKNPSFEKRQPSSGCSVHMHMSVCLLDRSEDSQFVYVIDY